VQIFVALLHDAHQGTDLKNHHETELTNASLTLCLVFHCFESLLDHFLHINVVEVFCTNSALFQSS
jgi:hypothetical protein